MELRNNIFNLHQPGLIAPCFPIQGCWENEIEIIKEKQEVKRLPRVYLNYLRLLGSGAGGYILSETSSYPEVTTLKSRAKFQIIHRKPSFELPSDAFVFALHWAGVFSYFLTDNNDENPLVYTFLHKQGVLDCYQGTLLEFIDGHYLVLKNEVKRRAKSEGGIQETLSIVAIKERLHKLAWLGLSGRVHVVKDCTHEEINSIKEKQAVDKLPQVYVDFLHHMGRVAGGLEIGQFYNYPRLKKFKEQAQVILDRDSTMFKLPPDAFVFATYPTYMFWYFRTDEDEENPSVYTYRYEDGLLSSSGSESLLDFYNGVLAFHQSFGEESHSKKAGYQEGRNIERRKMHLNDLEKIYCRDIP